MLELILIIDNAYVTLRYFFFVTLTFIILHKFVYKIQCYIILFIMFFMRYACLVYFHELHRSTGMQRPITTIS